MRARLFCLQRNAALKGGKCQSSVRARLYSILRFAQFSRAVLKILEVDPAPTALIANLVQRAKAGLVVAFSLKIIGAGLGPMALVNTGVCDEVAINHYVAGLSLRGPQRRFFFVTRRFVVTVGLGFLRFSVITDGIKCIKGA